MPASRLPACLPACPPVGPEGTGGRSSSWWVSVFSFSFASWFRLKGCDLEVSTVFLLVPCDSERDSLVATGGREVHPAKKNRCGLRSPPPSPGLLYTSSCSCSWVPPLILNFKLSFKNIFLEDRVEFLRSVLIDYAMKHLFRVYKKRIPEYWEDS